MSDLVAKVRVSDGDSDASGIRYIPVSPVHIYIYVEDIICSTCVEAGARARFISIQTVVIKDVGGSRENEARWRTSCVCDGFRAVYNIHIYMYVRPVRDILPSAL